MIPIPTLPGVVHEGQMTYESLRTLANQAFGKNDVFIGSGPTHRVGLVPDPGKDAGTAKYLCEDGTWTTVTASLVGGVALQAATPGVAQVGNANITGTMIATTFVGALNGNATTSSDGLTSATGTPPLTLTLAAKALTGSVAVMTGDLGAGGTKGLVPDQAIGDATKFLRGDATWQTVSTAAVTSISAGAGITLTPDPIVATGSVALTSPVVVTLGGTGTTTQFTPGSVVFAGVAGVYTEDNTNFFWNNATKCLGIDTAVPLYPLSLGSSTGNKIALYETGGGAGYGLGIQANLLQIFCDLVTDRVGVGYGNSGAFTETLTVKGSRVGIGSTSPGASLDVATKFYVDSNGNITKTNNVATSWPAANSAGVLTNDGAGNFSWSPAAGATITVTDTASATCWVALFEAATGTLSIHTDGAITYDASLGVLTSEISIPKVGSPSISTVNKYRTTTGSAGVSDSTIAYVVADPGTGPSSVKVIAGEGFLRTTNDEQGDLVAITWPNTTAASVAGLTLAAPAAGLETVAFIGIEYNAGTPQVTVRASFNWNWYTDFPLGRVVYDGTDLFILNADTPACDVASIGQKWNRLVLPFQREEFPEGTGGLEFSDVATRQLSMTGGNMWHGYEQYTISAIPAGDPFHLSYRDGAGGFTGTTVTQWPNTKYDDGTGALHTITSNKYACLWIYVVLASASGVNHIHVMYGRGEYATVQAAQAETAPSTSPEHVKYGGRLIGRLIFRESASSASLTESAWSGKFTPSAVGDHNYLTGLQGGTASQYYHMTSAQYGWYPSSVLTQGSVMFVGAAGVFSQDNSNFYWDDTNKRLGIGTPALPSYTLHVYRALGTTGTDDTLGYFNTVRNAADAGVRDVALTGAAEATHAALTVGTLVGVAGHVSATTGGTVTNAYSFRSSGSFSVGSVLTNRVGLYVEELTFAIGGSCTTQYGIKIETLSAASTNYSIYTGTAKTYLGGALDVAAAKFQVDTNGDIVKLRNVTTTFPNANASGLLANDGAGTLSWTGTLSGLGFSVATPTGAVNGVNKVYTLATAPVAGNYVILIDGQVVVEPADYAIAGVTLTVDAARAAPTMWIRILYGGGGSYSPAGSAASQHDNFTGDGLNDTFTFSATALADGIIYVSINGAIVDSGDYTYTTTDITFNVAPLLADDIGVGYYTSSGISGNPTIDTYAAVAAQTDFTLAHGAAAINVVSVNGLVLTSAGWTFYRPTTITLTTPCIGGEVVQVSYIY